MEIICLLADIFFVPEISKIFKGHEIQFLDNYKDEKFDLLIIDLDHSQSYEVCKKFPEKSFCFGSHKNTELMHKFAQTGCKSVVAISALKKKLEETNQSARLSLHS